MKVLFIQDEYWANNISSLHGVKPGDTFPVSAFDHVADLEGVNSVDEAWDLCQNGIREPESWFQHPLVRPAAAGVQQSLANWVAARDRGAPNSLPYDGNSGIRSSMRGDIYQDGAGKLLLCTFSGWQELKQEGENFVAV